MEIVLALTDVPSWLCCYGGCLGVEPRFVRSRRLKVGAIKGRALLCLKDFVTGDVVRAPSCNYALSFVV